MTTPIFRDYEWYEEDDPPTFGYFWCPMCGQEVDEDLKYCHNCKEFVEPEDNDGSKDNTAG